MEYDFEDGEYTYRIIFTGTPEATTGFQVHDMTGTRVGAGQDYEPEPLMQSKALSDAWQMAEMLIGYEKRDREELLAQMFIN